MLEGFDPKSIQDVESARRCIVMLLNLVEELKAANEELRAEVARLRDEIARLKGTPGKPQIKPNTERRMARDHSSEKERKKPETWHKRSKIDQVKIDREQVLEVDPATLPVDVEFKGYEEVVVQDVILRTDNILFRKEKYYSARAQKTYLAPLPPGYEGEFGPGLKALVMVWHWGANVTEPKILDLLGNVGIRISPGQLSNLLIKAQERFHGEKAAVYAAGLRSSPWQHIDDTATREKGQNQRSHVVGNPLYTAYFTTATKDRLAVLDVLCNFRERQYRLNAEAFGFLKIFGVSGRVVSRLRELPQEQDLSAAEFLQWLGEQLPKLGPQPRSRILESAAVAAYHAQLEWPVVELLVGDDAPQWKCLTAELALCWIHEGRHYKKLIPYVAHHAQRLESFLGQYWAYYRQLLDYREQAKGYLSLPTPGAKVGLSNEFDELFATVTGYAALDERIAKTRAKKESLLMVLKHPEIPLHNNESELGARRIVRQRDVSFGTRSAEGTRARDTFLTLVATAKKLGVSFYHYVYDRVSRAYQMPSLADLIRERAKELNLGASWQPP